MRFLKTYMLLFSFLAALLMTSCVKETEPDYHEKDYGYVQFKLYKEASYDSATKAVVSQLEYLSQAAKIKVTLSYSDVTISQTLTLTAADDGAAEYGLRSEKLKLLGGDYVVDSYTLYDKLDEELYRGDSKGARFTVVAGGLEICDLTANVQPRGKVRFRFVKDFKAQTKAASNEYTFDEIKYVSLVVKKNGASDRFSFDKIKTEFEMDFAEDDRRISYLQCDSLLSLPAGEYTVLSYSTYDSSKLLKETNTVPAESVFSISDNVTTDADVKITLNESDEYIKDYMALKEIWEALHGEDWYYSGEDFQTGVNWDFNKDVDLWGDQPGVELHSNGRVASLNLSDFGFYGDMPSAIGQLTELAVLYLGTHNDTNLLDYDPTLDSRSGLSRMEAHKAYMKLRHPATQMSEPVARALMENNISIPEIEMYTTMSEDQIIDKATGGMRIKPMDTVHGKKCNGLKSLPDEIGLLVNLEQLFIANGDIQSIPASVANLSSVTDLEIYNCSEMTEFPMAITQMSSLESINLSNNGQWSADDLLRGMRALASGPSAEKIQILYLTENNLEVVPEEFCNMKKIGLLDLSCNNINRIEKAFGKDINPVQMCFDNNQLSSLPTVEIDGKHIFCMTDDVETFSFKYNNFTEFPDIFSSEAKYVMSSVDFSFNKISGFQHNANGGTAYQGIKVSTLTLSNNPLKSYPIELSQSNSTVANINVRACNLNTIPEGSFTYENAVNITSIDFSYNELTSLPKEFHAGNMPYFYGIDLSYNRFSKFPFEPFDSAYLTVYGIRAQRDADGNRCLSQWPTGLYNHKGLRGFYIGSNNLGKIDDTISTLIYYLDISDNPNIVFDASGICSAWRVGAYYLIYDKTQDIRGCEYMLN
ncbi:MAG: DUF4458 domain-containing protein [Candidatus Cryptobacteroides sp.]